MNHKNLNTLNLHRQDWKQLYNMKMRVNNVMMNIKQLQLVEETSKEMQRMFMKQKHSKVDEAAQVEIERLLRINAQQAAKIVVQDKRWTSLAQTKKQYKKLKAVDIKIKQEVEERIRKEEEERKQKEEEERL